MTFRFWQLAALCSLVAAGALAALAHVVAREATRSEIHADLARTGQSLVDSAAAGDAGKALPSAQFAPAVRDALAKPVQQDGPVGVCWYLTTDQLPVVAYSAPSASRVHCPVEVPSDLATRRSTALTALDSHTVGIWLRPEHGDGAAALVLYPSATIEQRLEAARAGSIKPLTIGLIILLLLFALIVLPAALGGHRLLRWLDSVRSGRTGGLFAATSALPAWVPLEIRRSLKLLADLIDEGNARTHQADRIRAILNQAVAGMRDVLLVINSHGVVKLANRRARALFGHAPSVLQGMDVGQLLPDLHPHDGGDSQDALAALVAAARHAGPSAASLAATVRRVDGTAIPVALYVSATRDGDEQDYYVYLHDRRQELARETKLQDATREARAANDAKSRFLANVSHEIRTPLNGITGMTDLLARTPISEDQRELLDTLRSSSKILRRLLNDILDLSKIEAGEIRLESLPFDVQEQISIAIEAYRPAIEAKGLSLNFDSQLDVRMLLGDPYRITQILNNLIDNAVKFTDQGGIDVRLHVKMLHRDDEKAVLDVSVHDTGPGLPEDFERSLFLPFRQADSSTTRRYGGTGLGLTLCRQLCRAMHGNIRAESQPGRGSTFFVSLPLPIAVGMSPFQDTDRLPDDADLSVLRGARVLVVDDNRVNQTLLTRWLKAEDMSAVIAANGELAVEAASKAVYDCILMDLSMPVMGGADATRAIRALAWHDGLDGAPTNSAASPIIGVSAMASPVDREACLAAGMNDYVTKPIKRDELLGAMLRAMSPGHGTRGSAGNA